MIRKSLELTEAQWARLDELAEQTTSLAVAGPNSGGASWRVLVRNIADGHLELSTVYVNISDGYGDPVPVTIDDYLELNPEGRFEIDYTSDTIRQYYSDELGDWETVAVSAAEYAANVAEHPVIS